MIRKISLTVAVILIVLSVMIYNHHINLFHKRVDTCTFGNLTDYQLSKCQHDLTVFTYNLLAWNQLSNGFIMLFLLISVYFVR